MDNLAPHKSPKVIELIESARARVLLLPPYSPDYNPIEMAISKVKSLLRSDAKREIEPLFGAIGDALAAVTPRDAAAFIGHCGYSATDGCKPL